MFVDNSFKPREKRVYLSTPTMHGEELAYIREAYDTNWMSTIGENLNVIEKDFSELLQNKYAVSLSNGTAALHLAMRAVGIKRGDRVFCSDMTFAASVNPACYEGAELIFIDTEEDTWNMDPKSLKKAFEMYPDTRYVIVVDLYGTPAKLDEIKAICDENKAILIEDAAEALGATYKGRPTGSFGYINCISFNGNKIITGSSGGMLLTDDEEVAKHVKKMSTQAREAASWYQHTELGYNYRMSNVIAGVIRGQIPYIKEHIEQKKAIYYRYKEAFKDLPIDMNPMDLDICSPNYWLSCLTIRSEGMCRQIRTDMEASYEAEHGKSCPTEIMEKLFAYNCEPRPIWKPMHMQPIYKDCKFVSANDHDVSADIFERGLCLPSDNKMTIEEQDFIIDIVKSCFK